MPALIIRPEIVRGTLCRKKRWNTDLVILCPDRIPVGVSASLLFAVKWTPPRLDGETEISFRKLTNAASGEIRFDTADGDAVKQFQGDVRQLLTIVGRTATTGSAADVGFSVKIDGDERASFSMSVGNVTNNVRIQAEDGVSAPPPVIVANTRTKLKALADPAAPGSFTWASLDEAAVEISNDPHDGLVDLSAHAPMIANRKLCVVFTPQGGGQALMALHTVDVGANLFGRIEDRSVAPEFSAPTTAHRFPPALAFKIFNEAGGEVFAGVTQADGSFNIKVAPAAQYELRVQDFEGLASGVLAP